MANGDHLTVPDTPCGIGSNYVRCRCNSFSRVAEPILQPLTVSTGYPRTAWPRCKARFRKTLRSSQLGRCLSDVTGGVGPLFSDGSIR
jgi:hypothetical protein